MTLAAEDSAAEIVAAVVVMALIVAVYVWLGRWLVRWFKTPKDILKRISREAKEKSLNLGLKMGRSSGGVVSYTLMSAFGMDEIYFFAKGWAAYKRGEPNDQDSTSPGS